MRTRPFVSHLALATLSLGLLTVLCLPSGLLGQRLESAFAALRAAEPTPLLAAGIALVVMCLTSAFAWRTVLGACGSPLTPGDAVGRYGVGTGVNAIAPAHVGSALRLVLFGRVVHGGTWTAGGAAAAVGAIRGACLAGLVLFGAIEGVLPWWPLAAAAAVTAIGGLVVFLLRSCGLPDRVDRVLAALLALAGHPRELVITAGWSLAGLAAKVAAAALVLSAFHIDHAPALAVLVVPAVELAAVLPVTPGNVGVASAAAAFAMHAQGVEPDTALAAGIAFGAVELLAAVGFGAGSALVLVSARIEARARLAVALALSTVVAVTIGAIVAVA